jgi:hypothetical protein
MLDSWHGEELVPQVDSIEKAIGMPEAFDGSGSLQRSKRALHWHYTYDGPDYQIIVMDTRTERYYRAPTDFPGLLSPHAMDTQLARVRRDNAEVTLIISASPVVGIDFVESVQFWSHWQVQDNYAFDREAWALEWGTFQHFLRTVSTMKRVVFLSGDVHYAFGSSLEYWDMHTKETAKLVNYTASPLCNEGSGSQISVLAIGYPRLQQLLRRSSEPTLGFFIWDVAGEDHHTLNYLLTLIRRRLYRFWWAIPRLIAVLRSPQEIVLPAWGWLSGALDAFPPDRSYRLRYLRNTLVRTTEHEPRPHVNLSRLILKPLRATLGGVIFLQERARKLSRKLQRTTDASNQKTPRLLQRSTSNLVGEVSEGTDFIERRLEHPKQGLIDTLMHYETWLSRWKAGTLIVGYNNIGEISFNWNTESKEVKQRLWWYSPDDPQKLQSTDYSETLELPRAEEEPKLP